MASSLQGDIEVRKLDLRSHRKGSVRKENLLYCPNLASKMPHYYCNER